jgi:hypothetical protein
VARQALKMARHLHRDRFGGFKLTQAVRPALELGVTPKEGYRIQHHRGPGRDVRLPVLSAAISREKLFDVFLALLEPLGPVVDVILESSHHTDGDEPVESEREAIDLPILCSYCLEFEDLLMNDGCTGLAVLNESRQIEVHFDEHKLLFVYAARLAPFERILGDFKIRREDDLLLLTEAEHIHCTHPRFADEHQRFCQLLGVQEPADLGSW